MKQYKLVFGLYGFARSDQLLSNTGTPQFWQEDLWIDAEVKKASEQHELKHNMAGIDGTKRPVIGI